MDFSLHCHIFLSKKNINYLLMEISKPLAKNIFLLLTPLMNSNLELQADSKDVDLAVNSARVAFNVQWSKISQKESKIYI